MAALKLKVASAAEIPEAAKTLYKQVGTEFHLDLEGAEDLNRLDEFRRTNTDLARKATEYEGKLKQFEGIDPTMLATIREQVEQSKVAEEKELIKKGNFQELITRRTAAANAENERKISAANETLDKERNTNKALKARLASLLVDTDVAKAIEASGLKPRQGALADITRRARENWQVQEDGTLLAVEPGTKNQLFSKEKAGQALTMKEYVTGFLATEAGHLFEASGGGGSSGSRGGASGGGIPGPGGVTVLKNPSAAEFGKNLEAIKKGTVRVDMGGGS